MKLPLSMLLIGVILISSCSRSSNTTPKPSKQTELLTKITNNQAGLAGYEKSFMEFTYNGKQLVKEVDFTYKQDGSVDNTETTTFNYDNSGSLTGTTITNSNPTYAAAGFTGSTITMANGNISEIKLYGPNNVQYDDIMFTYQNGNVASSTSPLSGNDTYVYNGNGNNTQGYGQATNTMWDMGNPLASVFPYWIYFAYVRFPDGYMDGIPLYPGAHNVGTFTDGSTGGSYTYDYDNNHYPVRSIATVTSPGVANSYLYQYIQVN